MVRDMARSFFFPLLCLSCALAGCSSSDATPAPQDVPADAAVDSIDAPLADAAPETLDAPAPDADSEDGMPVEAGEDALPDAPADSAPCTLVRPYSQKVPACNECAERECCAEINTCLVDPACDDSFVNCMIACTLDADAGTIPPCIADCGDQYPTGKAEYDMAIGCADSKCAAECG